MVFRLLSSSRSDTTAALTSVSRHKLASSSPVDKAMESNSDTLEEETAQPSFPVTATSSRMT